MPSTNKKILKKRKVKSKKRTRGGSQVLANESQIKFHEKLVEYLKTFYLHFNLYDSLNYAFIEFKKINVYGILDLLNEKQTFYKKMGIYRVYFPSDFKDNFDKEKEKYIKILKEYKEVFKEYQKLITDDKKNFCDIINEKIFNEETHNEETHNEETHNEETLIKILTNKITKFELKYEISSKYENLSSLSSVEMSTKYENLLKYEKLLNHKNLLKYESLLNTLNTNVNK
jgi:hypothetical protein